VALIRDTALKVSITVTSVGQSRSHIATDGQSVSQSVSQSWCQAQSGAHDQIVIIVWQLLSCYCGAPSLTRGRVCLLSESLSAVISHLSVRPPCVGWVEYLHREPASRRRRRKGKSQIWDSKIWSRVPRDSDPRKTALARVSSMSYELWFITQLEPKRDHYLQHFAYYTVLSVAMKRVSIPLQCFDFYQCISYRGTCLPNHCPTMAYTGFHASCHSSIARDSKILQNHLYRIEEWLQKWRNKVNRSKSVYITFANRMGNCPPVTFNDQLLPQQEEVKYLGMHLQGNGPIRHVETCPDFFSLQEYTQQDTLSKF
jgi:hypothetical protein